MTARSQMLFGILALTIACVRSGSAQATEVRVPGGSAVHVLTVRVPSVVRVSIADGQTTPDGAPLVRVVTNDPSLRRMVARGIEPEEVQALSVQFSGVQHSKGGELAMDGQAQVTTSILRYTIVQP